MLRTILGKVIERKSNLFLNISFCFNVSRSVAIKNSKSPHQKKKKKKRKITKAKYEFLMLPVFVEIRKQYQNTTKKKG